MNLRNNEIGAEIAKNVKNFGGTEDDLKHVMKGALERGELVITPYDPRRTYEQYGDWELAKKEALELMKQDKARMEDEAIDQDTGQTDLERFSRVQRRFKVHEHDFERVERRYRPRVHEVSFEPNRDTTPIADVSEPVALTTVFGSRDEEPEQTPMERLGLEPLSDKTWPSSVLDYLQE